MTKQTCGKGGKLPHRNSRIYWDTTGRYRVSFRKAARNFREETLPRTQQWFLAAAPAMSVESVRNGFNDVAQPVQQFILSSNTPQITLTTKITTLTSKCWNSLAHRNTFREQQPRFTRMDTQLAMKKAINKDKKMAIKPAREPLNETKLVPTWVYDK